MLVQHFTDQVAAVVARDHADDPVGELFVWLNMALRREASVGEIYGVSNLELRLGELQVPRRIHELVAMTISNVWAQERAHAAYLDAVITAVVRRPSLRQWASARLEGLLGAIEGRVMSGRTSPSPVEQITAGLVIAVGRRVKDIPEFISSLPSMSFSEFCRFNADLEITAVHGYQRMLVLLESVVAESPLGRDTTLTIDIERMVRDERYHNGVFLALSEWFDSASGNSLRRNVSLDRCMARLAHIRARAYR